MTLERSFWIIWILERYMGKMILLGLYLELSRFPLYCISLNLALSFFNLWRYKTRFIVVWNQDSYSDLKRQKLNVFAGIKRDRFLKWDRILIRVLPSVTNCNHISLGLLIEILWEICDWISQSCNSVMLCYTS